jgi:nucleotide-binding universal stress UspA family protein
MRTGDLFSPRGVLLGAARATLGTAMALVSKILVPVDFSERARGVLPYVRAIAAQYHARVILMHVVSPFWGIPPTGLASEAWLPAPGSAIVDQSRELEEWAKGEFEGLEVERLVYEGDPVGQIVSYAESERVDLLVTSTHGYGALRRFLIGSVAAKLLHDLSCPVLTGVHLAEAKPSGVVQIQRVLCAVDFGPETASLLAYAGRFARDFSADLEVMHVVPEFHAKYELETAANWESRLAATLAEEVRAAGAEAAKIQIEQGETVEAICARAAAMDASVLVIGRGAPESGGRRLKTEAYAVVRQSPCPVLSI